MKLPRVIVADDHNLVAEALNRMIASDFNVIAQVGDGRTLVSSTLSLKPDAIVADIAMPLLNGLDACRQIHTKMPLVKIIFLTMNEDADLAAEAMKMGASGYLLKKSAGPELVQALHAALKGKTYITAQMARGLEESFIRNPRGGHQVKSLTPRQREVVQLLAEGKSMKEAADVLSVTPRTVAFHKYRVMEDLGLKSSADLIHYAIKSQIRVA